MENIEGIELSTEDIITDENYLVNNYVINHKNELDFSSISVSKYSKKYLFYDLFYVDNHYWKYSIEQITKSKKIDKFILFTDWGEAFSSVKIPAMFGLEHIQETIKYFENNNILDKLVWRSNGLNPQFEYKVKFEPISFWLGKNIENAQNILPRKFDYNFLSLYRGYKKYREDFHNFLQEGGILKKTLFSYNSELEIADWWTNDYMISLDDKKSITADMLVKPGKYYQNTFCSIVYEAFWDEGVVFPTEKLNKCLLTGHPFIIVSTPEYLSNIKKIGFKTFDKWWDESYDGVVNDYERFKKLQTLVLEVGSWSIKKCEKIFQEMIPTLIHNQQILYKLSEFNTNETYNVLDIEVDMYKKNAI